MALLEHESIGPKWAVGDRFSTKRGLMRACHGNLRLWQDRNHKRGRIERRLARPFGTGDDEFLPAQYNGRLVDRRRLEGEWNLMCAVLQDAIQRHVKAFRIHTIEERREFAQLNRWFKAHNQVGPFAFEGICEALDLEPGRPVPVAGFFGAPQWIEIVRESRVAAPITLRHNRAKSFPTTPLPAAADRDEPGAAGRDRKNNRD
jgi:hypothetical protein